MSADADPGALRAPWLAAWPGALAAWSRFVKLGEPRWCLTKADEKREGLKESFAMIRLSDHGVVVSLRKVAEMGLQGFALPILAHEVGHHVYAPADLRDHGRLMARIRSGLPSREAFAPLVSNLYVDLLVNDRLQRTVGMDIVGVYAKLRTPPQDRVWTLYMRIYERLWSLPAGSLAFGPADKGLELDADLGARILRAYAKDWLRGGSRFAALLLTYLLETEPESLAGRMRAWLDAVGAGEGDAIPDGLAEIDEDERDGAVHPADDPRITGLEDADGPAEGGTGSARAASGGRKRTFRSPEDYGALLDGLGVTVSPEERVIRYYRELAVPHLIRFPAARSADTGEPVPEGLEEWDPGSPMSELDWSGSLTRGPYLIPGVTTLRRTYGTSPGRSEDRAPPDLYIGIDCSGSMKNPAKSLSYPVLAGTILAVSALRAGASVMACLSGEPGRFSQTKGFLRCEKEILAVLTGYLGTGYAFGISRLKETFCGKERGTAGGTHVVVISDSDMFAMLGKEDGWKTAEEAVRRAGGGGTFVLEIQAGAYPDPVRRMTEIGWNVHAVTDRERLVDFARAFSRMTYEKRR